MKIAKIKVPIFGSWLVLVNYKKPEERDKFCDDININHNGSESFCYYKHDERAIYICLQLDEPIAVVAHEALHATNFILADVGADHNRDDDEVPAYLLKWIMEQIKDAKYKDYK